MHYGMTGKVTVMREGAMDELAMAGEGRGWRVSGNGDMTWFGAVFGRGGCNSSMWRCIAMRHVTIWHRLFNVDV